MLSDLTIFDLDLMSYSSQSPVCGIEELFSRDVILWSEPLGLQYSPKCLDDVEMWRVWRQEEQIQTTPFPNLPQFGSLSAPVYRSIVKHDDRFLLDCEREPVKKVNHLRGADIVLCGESVINIVTADHTEDIQTRCFLGGYMHVLSLELPCIGDVPLGADMALVTIIQVYAAFGRQSFKFLQFLALVGIELRRRFSLWAFSHTLISCANALKKRLNVMSLASLPVASCHAWRARLTLCRSSAIAARTASSSEQSMIGFRPRPGLVYSPLKPSERYRFNHEYTLMAVISVNAPTVSLVIPWDFSNMAWQRMRKQWLSPLWKPSSSSMRWEDVSSIVDILRLMFVIFDMDRTKKRAECYI